MTLVTKKDIEKRFWDNFDGRAPFSELMTPEFGVYFFIKDFEGYIIKANQLTVERCGCKLESELIGKTDYDFFPRDLAEKYRTDDIKVIRSNKAIIGMAELAPNKNGIIDVWITNKIPLHDRNGEAIAVAGTTRCHDETRQTLGDYLPIAATLDHIKTHYMETITIADLADMVGMPQRKYTDTFKSVFTITPQTYIIKMRVHYACEELMNTSTPIAEIAKKVGFYDHITLTRQFAKHMGMPPSEYRKRYKD